VRALADQQAVRYVISQLAKIIDFGEQRLRIDHHAVSDRACDV
jgi:hypothetical protein